MLYQLPNGTWIDPMLVDGVCVLPGSYAIREGGEDLPARIVVHHRGNTVINCQSLADAEEMCKKVGAEINTMQNAGGMAGEVNPGSPLPSPVGGGSNLGDENQHRAAAIQSDPEAAAMAPSAAIDFLHAHSAWLAENWSMSPEGREYKCKFDAAIQCLELALYQRGS
jgi:hypothetical protein